MSPDQWLKLIGIFVSLIGVCVWPAIVILVLISFGPSLRACPQTPQLPGLVFDPTATTSVVVGAAGGRARHPRAVAHPQERRGGGCGASGDRW